MCSVSPVRNARRGFVLISVLMLGVILISCATTFAWFARVQVKSTDREKSSLESRSMAQVLASVIIKGLQSNTSVKYDSPLLEWFRPFFFPAGDLGIWVVQITPLDDKIPLRNLFLPDNNTLRNELKSTWDNLWLKLERRDLTYIVLDFLDKDKRPRMSGAERDDFINRAPVDMSELLILEEMTPALLYGDGENPGVADYCTLWSSGKINLNVAPVRVMALLPGLDDSLAGKIADHRERNALKGTSDLRSIAGFPPRALNSLMNLAAFKSDFFLIRIEAIEDAGGGKSFSIVVNKATGQIVRWEEI